MCLCELISRLNSKVSWILSYVENFLNIICDFFTNGGYFFCIFYMVKKIEQPIEKLSESFLDLSLNWAPVGELKKTVNYSQLPKIWTLLNCLIEKLTIIKFQSESVENPLSLFENGEHVPILQVSNNVGFMLHWLVSRKVRIKNFAEPMVKPEKRISQKIDDLWKTVTKTMQKYVKIY